MKFVVERAAILKPLQRAARIAVRGNQNTIPMLSHVQIEARKNGKAVLIATDMDRQVEVAVPTVELAKAGATTANARTLAEFVSNAPEGTQIEFELPKVDGRLTLRAGRGRAAFAVLPAEDFPKFNDQGSGTLTVVVDGAALHAALGAVAHAQSNEETRYYLNGTYLHAAGGELVCVATDGHRLARATLPVADLPEGLPGIIIPSASTAEIMALAAKTDTLELAINDHALATFAGDVVFRTKLIDGTFPDYERVCPPKDVATGFEVDRNAFLLATKRCVAIVSDKMRALKLTPNDRSIELLGKDADRGEISDEIDAQTSTKMPVGVNAKYLAGALDALQGTTVCLRYADPGAPIALTDPADASRLQIVMPVRV
jgi:DNA polymerase-3 subunit beta